MLRALITDKNFMARHRYNEEDFTRKRKLPFIQMLLVICQKSVKSLQLMLNEFFGKLMNNKETVTVSAFSQARKKLSYTAFIELGQKVADLYYSEGSYKTWKEFRLLAIDGSQIILPNTKEICNYFGVNQITNGKDKTVIGYYPSGLASIMYDVINHIPIDSILAKGNSYEVDLGVSHLEHTQQNDLIISDRNYLSFRFLAILIKKEKDFLCRCSRASFQQAQQMFNDTTTPDSQIVTLSPSRANIKEIQSLGLGMSITVRFIRVILDSGEIEVLVTSLINEIAYPAELFKELYHLRWGIETLYGTIKSRLNLENFTGKTVEAVKQDFYATIFITGLESILIEDAQHQLDKKQEIKNNKYSQQVNKLVSFNAIKNHVIDLLYSDYNDEDVLNILTKLFLTKTIPKKPEPGKIRKKSSMRILYNFQRRSKKICF
jgi:hypothetical protein